MRLWSLHPRYLDARGLSALWREGLLALAVLSDRTRGYRHHPQLDRFKAHPDPVAAINTYLLAVLEEAVIRGYRFDSLKLLSGKYTRHKIPVSKGQVLYELEHLRGKLKTRAPKRAGEMARLTEVSLNPLFYLTEGGVAEWERARV
ncbi:MAG TPA: hypothetical protein ENN60_02475 [archaeon]|nr:hypothetical protein [archaeon]